MSWKSLASKFSGRMSREKWIGILAIGVLLMILSSSMPVGQEESEAVSPIGLEEVPLWEGNGRTESGGEAWGEAGGEDPDSRQAGAPAQAGTYEEQLENRICQILKSVEGVGKVEVMVVLRSSGEKVMRIDRSTSQNTTSETDSSGGSRQVSSSQSEESTVLSSGQGTSGGNEPVIEKELSPELSGIIISAEGGGSPEVKAEISEAMEALLGLPAHKIKVLKRTSES